MANWNNPQWIKKSKEESKIRVLAIALMLSDGRRLSTKEIMRQLELKYDIQVNRKTIFADLRAIDRLIPLDVTYGKNGGFKKWEWSEDAQEVG